MSFKKVDPKQYVQELIEKAKKNGGKGLPRKFIKVAPVKAYRAVSGNAYVAMVKDRKTGKLMAEHEPHIAKEGDWVIQNKGGEVYLNDNETFHKLYGESDKEGKRKPLARLRTLIRINEDICFDAPWGGEMRIQAGGWLNIDDLEGIYGINPEEFDGLKLAILNIKKKDKKSDV